MKKLILLALLGVLCLVSYKTAHSNQGVGLSPSIQEIVMKEADKSVEFEVDVTNFTSSPVEFDVSLMDFGSLDESGGIAFLGRPGQEATDFGLKKWMSVENPNFRLEPGKSNAVKVTITNSSDMSPGGHYGAVVVSSKAPEPNDNDGVSVLPAASSLVLLKKQGGKEASLDLSSLKASSSLIRLPNSAELRFENKGNIHLVPRGTVELFSPSGGIVGRATVNESSGFILPKSNRAYAVSLGQDSNSPWLPGRYKLVMTWRWDGREEAFTHVSYHWYIGKIVLFLSVMLLVFSGIFTYARYRRRPATRY